MESSDVDGSLKQSKQQVCKHVILDIETEGGIMFNYIVTDRENIVFPVVQKKELLKHYRHNISKSKFFPCEKEK